MSHFICQLIDTDIRAQWGGVTGRKICAYTKYFWPERTVRHGQTKTTWSRSELHRTSASSASWIQVPHSHPYSHRRWLIADILVRTEAENLKIQYDENVDVLWRPGTNARSRLPHRLTKNGIFRENHPFRSQITWSGLILIVHRSLTSRIISLKGRRVTFHQWII